MLRMCIDSRGTIAPFAVRSSGAGVFMCLERGWESLDSGMSYIFEMCLQSFDEISFQPISG